MMRAPAALYAPWPALVDLDGLASTDRRVAVAQTRRVETLPTAAYAAVARAQSLEEWEAAFRADRDAEAVYAVSGSLEAARAVLAAERARDRAEARNRLAEWFLRDVRGGR